jgi:adenosylcobinamide-phosphate synthase
MAGGLSGGSEWGPGPLCALCALLVFKVASTMDSMVGYKNEKYEALGWAGAKLDDVMNFIPARLSFLFLFLGACSRAATGFRGSRWVFGTG